MGRINGMHHVSVDTFDMEKSLNFYCDQLGFQLVHREMCSFGDFALVRLGNAAIELIVQSDPAESFFNTRGTISHFGLDVSGIDALFEELKAKGVEFLSDHIEESPDPAGGIRYLSLLGPSGEEINLYQFSRQL